MRSVNVKKAALALAFAIGLTDYAARAVLLAKLDGLASAH